jgi:hypothetical protein
MYWNVRSERLRKLSGKFRGVLTTRKIVLVMHWNFRRKRLFTHGILVLKTDLWQ